MIEDVMDEIKLIWKTLSRIEKRIFELEKNYKRMAILNINRDRIITEVTHGND